jgi:hypothetical protein
MEINRRDLIRRGVASAALAGALWSTPVVQSLPAHALGADGSGPPEGVPDSVRQDPKDDKGTKNDKGTKK